jgi:hypothetical protein
VKPVPVVYRSDHVQPDWWYLRNAQNGHLVNGAGGVGYGFLTRADAVAYGRLIQYGGPLLVPVHGSDLLLQALTAFEAVCW